jgi:hypothetical protein
MTREPLASIAFRSRRVVTIAIRPSLSKRNGRSKAQTSEKRKQNIFCQGAGQEFGKSARRANQFVQIIELARYLALQRRIASPAKARRMSRKSSRRSFVTWAAKSRREGELAADAIDRQPVPAFRPKREGAVSSHVRRDRLFEMQSPCGQTWPFHLQPSA